jgi:hypothetical protein
LKKSLNYRDSTQITRSSAQVKANEGAGVPEITESKLAVEFITKLDPKPVTCGVWCVCVFFSFFIFYFIVHFSKHRSFLYTAKSARHARIGWLNNYN